MQVSGSRPIISTPARPLKATAAAPAPAASKAATSAKPRVPNVEAKAEGPHARYGLWGGAIGGGLVGGLGVALPAMFINFLAGGTAFATLPLLGVVAGAAVVGAGIGAGIGYLTGSVEDKVLDKVAQNPTSQWGFYVSGYGAIHTAGALLKGAATGLNGALTGIGSVFGGLWQTAVEVKGLKEGGPLTDNKVRLAGAAAATVGGLAAASALVPAVAAAVPFIVPVGGGLAAAGWLANLAGQFMNEKRNEAK